MPCIAARLLPIRRLPPTILARHAISEGLVKRRRIDSIICTSTHATRIARAGRVAATAQDLREGVARNSAVGRHVLAVLLELGGRGAGAFAGYTGAVGGLEVRVVADAVKVGAVDVGVDLAVDEDVVVGFTRVLAAVGLSEDSGRGPEGE